MLNEVLSELGVGAAAGAVRGPGAAGGQEECRHSATLGEVSRGLALSLWQEILTWMLQTQAVGF